MTKVLIAFEDKYTHKVYYKGDEAKLTPQREAELVAGGFVEASAAPNAAEKKPLGIEENSKKTAKKPAHATTKAK